MPIVTDQLFHYWNTKDGIKTGNVLANIAPGQAAKPLTIVGATPVSADGSLRFDGVDDYATAAFSGSNYETRNVPYTLELVFSPHTWGGKREILDGGIYLVYDNGVIGAEVAHDANTQPTFPAWEQWPGLNNTALTCMTFVYEGGTTMRAYNNGSLFATTTLRATTAIAAQGYTRFDLFRGVYAGLFGANLHAVRFYKKALTAAEVAQNWGMGKEIGLTSPQIKTGELKAAPGIALPIYDLANHPTEKLRVRTTDGNGFLSVVPTTDPNASKVRVRIGGVTMAIKK